MEEKYPLVGLIIAGQRIFFLYKEQKKSIILPSLLPLEIALDRCFYRLSYC